MMIMIIMIMMIMMIMIMIIMIMMMTNIMIMMMMIFWYLTSSQVRKLERDLQTAQRNMEVTNLALKYFQ